MFAFLIWLQSNIATTEFSWRANVPSLLTTASGIIIVVLNQLHEGRKAKIDRDKRAQEDLVDRDRRAQEAKIDYDRRAQEAQQRLDERASFIAEALAISNKDFRDQLSEHAVEIKHAVVDVKQNVVEVKKELKVNTAISEKAFDVANHVNEKILSIAEGRRKLDVSIPEINAIVKDTNTVVHNMEDNAK